MRHRLELERLQLTAAGDAQCIIEFFDLTACSPQLGRNRLHVLGDDIVQHDVTLCDSGGHHIAACLDLVRNDGIVAAMHLFDAVDLNDIGTGAVYISTHHVQEVGKIHDMRLTRNIFQNGRTLGQHGSQHGIHRGTNRHRVKKDMCACQMLSLDMNLAVLNGILCPEGGKGLEMLVNGARAQIAAARHGDLTGAEAPEQRAQKIVAGAHLAGQLVRYLGTFQMGRIDLIGTAADHADIGTQLA